MLLPPPYPRRGTHRTPLETAERGSRALPGLAERQTREQGRVGRRLWGGTTMPGSWCLPWAAPDAAVEEEEEEALAPAEGNEGTRERGGGGGLEDGTDRKRCGRDRARGKRHCPSSVLPLCCSRTRGPRWKPNTIHQVWMVACDGKGCPPRRAEVEQRAGEAQSGGAGRGWGAATRTNDATTYLSFPRTTRRGKRTSQLY